MGGFGGETATTLRPGTQNIGYRGSGSAGPRRGGRAGPVNQGRAGPSRGGSAGPRGGGGGGGRRSKPPRFDANEAEYDPFAVRHTKRIERRLADTEGPVGRELDFATGRRRAATAGQLQSARLDLARRGMLGTSSGEETLTGDIMADEAGDLADIQAGISYDRENANDRFLLGSGSAMAAPGAGARADRAVNRASYAEELEQWENDRTYEMQREAQGLNNFLAQLNFLSGAGGLGHMATGKL